MGSASSSKLFIFYMFKWFIFFCCVIYKINFYIILLNFIFKLLLVLIYNSNKVIYCEIQSVNGICHVCYKCRYKSNFSCAMSNNLLFIYLCSSILSQSNTIMSYYLNPILLCQNLFYILSYAIIVLIYKYVVTF